MKKIIISLSILISFMAVAKSDKEIAENAMINFKNCLSSPYFTKKSLCAEHLKREFLELQDPRERIPAINLANRNYELLVKIDRKEISNQQDIQIEVNKIETQYNIEIQQAQQTQRPQNVYVQPTNTQQAPAYDWSSVPKTLTPNVTQRKEIQPLTGMPNKQRNCTTTFYGNVANTTCN